MKISKLFEILAIIWGVFWLLNFIFTFTCNYGMAGCSFASLALYEIYKHEGK